MQPQPGKRADQKRRRDEPMAGTSALRARPQINHADPNEWD